MTTTDTPRPAPHASERWHGRPWVAAAVAAVFVLEGLTWLALYRWLLFTGDDFLHTGGPGRLHGRMTAQELLQSYARDYTQINGRAADTLARVVMQWGVTGWQLLGPVVITLISATAYVLMRIGKGRLTPSLQLWQAIMAAGIPLIVVALRPELAGQVYFWISAAVGYLVGVLLLLAAGSFYVTVRRMRLSTPALVGYAGLMVLTHLYHETASVGLLAMGVVFWAYHPRRQVDGRVAWVSAASVAGFLANLLSPGSLSRLLMATGPRSPEALGLLDRMSRGATMLHTLVWPAVLIAAVAAVLLVLRRPSVKGAALALVGGVTAALGAARTLRGEDVRVLEGVDVILPWVFAAFFLLLFVLAFTNRQSVGYTTLHLLAGAAGCGAIPVVMGTFERGHLPAALLAWFASVSLLIDLVRTGPSSPAPPTFKRWTGRVVLGAVLIPFVIAVSTTAVHTYRATRADHAVWEQTERQIAEARRGTRDTVVFPDARRMPYPQYVYNNAYLMRRYEPMIRSYYGLGPDVSVVVGRQPRG